MKHSPPLFSFFFFNDTATTEIYTLSLHDALPISNRSLIRTPGPRFRLTTSRTIPASVAPLPAQFLKPYWGCGLAVVRSEEHTSELQSLAYLVCRLLLEKKKKIIATLFVYTGYSES